MYSKGSIIPSKCDHKGSIKPHSTQQQEYVLFESVWGEGGVKGVQASYGLDGKEGEATE